MDVPCYSLCVEYTGITVACQYLLAECATIIADTEPFGIGVL